MKEGLFRFTVEEHHDGTRLDSYISSVVPELSRSFAQKIISTGKATLNGKIRKISYKVRAGDEVVITLRAPEKCSAEPQNIPLTILYEDRDIAVVEKPAGMVVHPSPGHYSGTLVNALLYHLDSISSIAGTLRPGIVHRLDKDVSGIIVVAKNDKSHASLSAQFKSRETSKVYFALLWGVLKESEGKIRTEIGRHLKDRKKMAVSHGKGKMAVTDYTVIERFRTFTSVNIDILTGRTHQIRVHMSYKGHSIIGDEVYGGQRWKSMAHGEVRTYIMNMNRIALHARRLGFRHPGTDKWMDFESSVPSELEKLIQLIRNNSA